MLTLIQTSKVLMPRQANGELGKGSWLTLDGDRAAVLLRDDVVADREAQAGALTSRLGRKERLEQLVPDLGWDAGAVVLYPHLDAAFHFARGDCQGRPIGRVGVLG